MKNILTFRKYKSPLIYIAMSLLFLLTFLSCALADGAPSGCWTVQELSRDGAVLDLSGTASSFALQPQQLCSLELLPSGSGKLLFLGMAFDKNSSLPNLICTSVDLSGALPSLSPYTVLDRHVNATFLTPVSDSLIYIRHDRDADSSSLARLNLESLTVEILTDNIPELSYLSFRNNRLYFTGENHHYFSSALDGSDIQPILEKEIYYPCFLTDDWLLYQDSADNESFHLFRLSDGADVVLTSVPSFHPVLSGSMLYFLTQQEDDLLHLSRIDFSKPSSSPDILYDLEVSPLPSSGEFYISGNTIYGCNQQKTDLPHWKSFSDYTPDVLPSFRTFYTDDTFLISIEMDDYQGGNIRSIYLQDILTGKEAVFPHVY